MTTNVQGTRTVNRAGEPVVEPTPTTPVVTPTGVGGIAVYDRDVDRAADPTLRPAGAIHSDPTPVETRSSGSILSWIIAAAVVIIIAYFLLQLIF